MSIERQSTDLRVGVVADGPMQAQVSVRGGHTVVLAFVRGPRGFEVAFSAKAARKLTEVVEVAAKVAEGHG